MAHPKLPYDCPAHGIVDLKWQATKEILDSHTELHKDTQHALSNFSKQLGDVKADVTGLAAKLTLITIIATPVWGALAALLIKYVLGLNLSAG